jgi:hypothetical protein
MTIGILICEFDGMQLKIEGNPKSREYLEKLGVVKGDKAKE